MYKLVISVVKNSDKKLSRNWFLVFRLIWFLLEYDSLSLYIYIYTYTYIYIYKAYSFTVSFYFLKLFFKERFLKLFPSLTSGCTRLLYCCMYPIEISNDLFQDL